MSAQLILQFKKKLDSFLHEKSNGSTAVSVESGSESLSETLDKLSKIEIHLDQLKSTGIGATVAKLRRQLSEDTSNEMSTVLLHKADSLVKDWKSLARKEIVCSKTPVSQSSRQRSRSLCTTQLSELSTGDQNDSSDETASRKSSFSVRSADVAALVSPDALRSSTESICDDSVRQKSAKLISDALKTGDALEFLKKKCREPASIEHIGENIEMAVFCAHGKSSSGPKYKARIRQILFNLKHKENDILRTSILIGDIAPEKLATMCADELAPARVRSLRRSMEQEALLEHEMPNTDATTTEHSQMFRCHECGERDTSYSLSQERMDGEYEPVPVTLVACNKCGNRWKSH